MKIHTADYIKSAPALKDCPDFDGLREIVLVGRSNVGKSSFINSMTSRKNLARTSNTPGKTRYINFYKITYSNADGEGDRGTLQPSASKASLTDEVNRRRDRTPDTSVLGTPQALLFVDLPGYGYAKVSKTEQEHWRRNLEAYLLKRESIGLIVQLIDARHGAQDNDIQMFEWLQHHGKRVQVILTKSDKLSRNEAAKQATQTARALDLDLGDLLIYSAETHLGRDASWKLINAVPQEPAPAVSHND